MAHPKGPLIAKIVIGGVLGFVLLAAAVAVWADHTYTKPGPLAEDAVVVIEAGMPVAGTARRLEQMGAVESRLGFRWAARLSGSSKRLQAGEYRIPAKASIRDILDILKSGVVVVHRLTLPEGLTSLEAVQLLNSADKMTGQVTDIPAEGTLLPETYYYTYGMQRSAMLARMQAGMKALVANLWEGRADGLPITTPEDAVILASIVEKETAVPAERPLIAGVFINRLKRNMRLQSDPTVIYGITHGADLGRDLTTADIDTTTPYNTYRIDGLPPTPIANPGRESLNAVLHPAETDALYFVADGNGGHAFSSTYEEHLKNVKRWRQLGK